MEKPWIKKLIIYIVCALVASGFAALIISRQNITEAAPVEQYRILCDAFTVPGLVLVLTGGIVWAVSVFMSDGSAKARATSRKDPKKNEKPSDAQAKEEKTKRITFKQYAFLFIVGGVFLAIAAVFLVLNLNTTA